MAMCISKKDAAAICGPLPRLVALKVDGVISYYGVDFLSLSPERRDERSHQALGNATTCSYLDLRAIGHLCYSTRKILHKALLVV